MIKVTKEKWDKIPSDYKGKWTELIVNLHNMNPDWIGRKTVFSGSIGGEGGTTLLTEDVHFEIVD